MVTAAHINTPDIEDLEELDEEDLYPSSDGKPMGETDYHIIQMFDLFHMLRSRYFDQENVYVASDNLIYYEEGNKKRFISPDVYVVFGVPKRVRSTYLIWREGGKAPNIVFEITSRSTRREDTGTKMALYQNVLRVPEYFLFDPTGEYLRPHQLQGYRLENGIYHPISSLDGLLHSEQIGLDMWAENNKLVLYDPLTSKTLRTPDQDGAYAQEQERIAKIERRFAAEQERLAAEQKRIAEAQQRIAEQQHFLAVKEMERAERAEAELARLQAELEALRKQNR